MTPVLTVALPVFAVIAAGFLAGRGALMRAEDAGVLNRFVFTFAMPAALFGLTARAEPVSGADAALAMVYGLSVALIMTLAYVIGRRLFTLAPAAAGAHALASSFGNAVFLGLPIALVIPGWAEHFVILMLVEGVGVIAAGAALMDPPDGESGRLVRYLRAPFRNPIVVGMLAGLATSVVLRATGLALPGPVDVFVDLLGRAAGPTALFSLGLFLATTPAPRPGEVAGRIAAIFSLKMIALPALMAIGLAAAGLNDPALKGAALLFVVTPSAVGAFVMASQREVYVRETAAAIAVTTAISVLTISAVLAVFA